MKYLIYSLLIIFLLSLIVGLFSQIRLFGAVPNLLLILVVLTALQKDLPLLFFTAFLGGLFLDFYSGVFLGSFTLAFLLLGLLIHVFAEQILVHGANWKYLAGFLAAGIFIADAVVWSYNAAALHFGWALYAIDLRLLRARFLPELCYNLLLLFPMYWLSAKTLLFASLLERKRMVL